VGTTVDHVRGLLAQEAARGVKFVILVGGFADCPLLSTAVHDAFERDGRRVIKPLRPGEVVNKGAAWYGMYPNAFISSR
jgi:molecular chaperone DnaK (HSP70)